MQHAPWPLPLEVLQPLDVRHIRHRKVPAGNHNRIECFRPPEVILAVFCPPSQRDLPLFSNLLASLHARLVRNQIFVVITLDQPDHVVSDRGPVAERRVGPVQRDGARAAGGRDSLLAVFHRDSVDVRFEVRVDGVFIESRLVVSRRVAWEGGWEFKGSVCCSGR